MNLNQIIKKRQEELKLEFEKELESHKSNNFNESSIHQFLEKNPYFLPNVGGDICGKHHGVYSWIVITQFELINAMPRKPDFAFITKNSAGMCLNLIEIEAPNRKIFGKNSELSRDFLHSIETQIGDWRAILENPTSKLTIRQQLESLIDHHMFRTFDDFDVRYFLIYGRRSEFESNNLQKSRYRSCVKKNKQNNIEIMTWDRLCPEIMQSNLLVVQFNSTEQAWIAKEMSRYVDFDYNYCQCWKKVKNIPAAIEKNKYLTSEEKKDQIEKYNQFSKMSYEDHIRGEKRKL